MDLQQAQDKTAEVRRKFYEARDRVNNDPRRSAEAKRDDVGRLASLANTQLGEVESAYRNAQAARLSAVTKRLFSTAAPSSYRDAVDRARATPTGNGGHALRRLLDDATRSGDVELARGVLSVALDRSDNETLAAIAEARPGIAETIAEYRHLAGETPIDLVAVEGFTFQAVTP